MHEGAGTWGGPQFELYEGSCRGLFPIGDSDDRDDPNAYTEESYNAETLRFIQQVYLF